MWHHYYTVRITVVVARDNPAKNAVTGTLDSKNQGQGRKEPRRAPGLPAQARAPS